MTGDFRLSHFMERSSPDSDQDASLACIATRVRKRVIRLRPFPASRPRFQKRGDRRVRRPQVGGRGQTSNVRHPFASPIARRRIAATQEAYGNLSSMRFARRYRMDPDPRWADRKSAGIAQAGEGRNPRRGTEPWHVTRFSPQVALAMPDVAACERERKPNWRKP